MTRPTDDSSPGWQPVTKPVNDEESFRILYERHYPLVYSFFARQGFSSEESQDLTQETFIRVYRGIGSFRGDASFRTWLLRIALNIWRNELRNRASAKRSAAETPLDALITAAESAATQSEAEQGVDAADRVQSPVSLSVAPPSLEDDLARERIRVALAKLPPRMRRCVELRFGQGLKYREIASVMQTSLNAVKSQLSQARERLARELGEHFAGIERG